MLVGGKKTIAGLHPSNSHCSLSWLTGHQDWLLVRLLWYRNLLQKREKICLYWVTPAVFTFISSILLQLPDRTALAGTGPSCLASGCLYCFAGCRWQWGLGLAACLQWSGSWILGLASQLGGLSKMSRATHRKRKHCDWYLCLLSTEPYNALRISNWKVLRIQRKNSWLKSCKHVWDLGHFRDGLRHLEEKKSIWFSLWCPSKISARMASCVQSEKGSHFTVLVKRPKSGTTSRRHEVRRTPFSEQPKMVALYSEPGGESSQLNVKVTKKRHLKILSLVTHVWLGVGKKEGVSFNEGACGVWYPGRKSGYTMNSCIGKGLFLPTLISYRHLQTKHEMTVISNTPGFMPF